MQEKKELEYNENEFCSEVEFVELEEVEDLSVPLHHNNTFGITCL